MGSTAFIQLESDKTQVCFNWIGFDGKNRFADFQIAVTAADQARHFEFGPCGVSEFRSLARFLADPERVTIQGRFGRSESESRCYDLVRWSMDQNDSYRLVIRFRSTGLEEEYPIHQPFVRVSDDFLARLSTIRPLTRINPDLADILDQYESRRYTLRDCFRPILFYLDADSVGAVLQAFPAELTQMFKSWAESKPRTDEEWSQYKEYLLGICWPIGFTAEDARKAEESEKQLTRRTVQLLREHFEKRFCIWLGDAYQSGS